MNRLGRCGAPAVLLALALGVAGGCGGGDDVAAFCEEMERATAPDGPVALLDIDNPDSVLAAVAAVDALAAAAPGDIDDDMGVVARVYHDVVTSVAGTAANARDDVLRDQQDELDRAVGATLALSSYVEERCGFVPGGLAPITPSSTPVPTPSS